jgi:hypothetical protein
MSRGRKHGNNHSIPAVPPAGCLPQESSPSNYYSQLVFTHTGEGTGPLCIVGQELQLVWYRTEIDRARERDGKIVAIIEIHDCRIRRDHRGGYYLFSGMLLEEMSGEYREWLKHQEYRGRQFAEDTQVLETEVRFSVIGRGSLYESCVTQAPANLPFLVEQPKIEDLSSPQVDILFDVMTFIYQSIPAMKLMEDLQSQSFAKRAK